VSDDRFAVHAAPSPVSTSYGCLPTGIGVPTILPGALDPPPPELSATIATTTTIQRGDAAEGADQRAPRAAAAGLGGLAAPSP